MALVLAERLESETSKMAVAHVAANAYELVVLCPACKTLETLSFSNGLLEQTRRFNQLGDRVFHDCGSQQPCRLYRTW